MSRNLIEFGTGIDIRRTVTESKCEDMAIHMVLDENLGVDE